MLGREQRWELRDGSHTFSPWPQKALPVLKAVTSKQTCVRPKPPPNVPKQPPTTCSWIQAQTTVRDINSTISQCKHLGPQGWAHASHTGGPGFGPWAKPGVTPEISNGHRNRNKGQENGSLAGTLPLWGEGTRAAFTLTRNGCWEEAVICTTHRQE